MGNTIGNADRGVVGTPGANLEDQVRKDEDNQVRTNAGAQEKLAGAAESFPSAVAGGVGGGSKPSGGDTPAKTPPSTPPPGDAAGQH